MWEWLSLAVYLLVLGGKEYIMAVLVDGVVDFALHCMAWMVYPDLALSVRCDGIVLELLQGGRESISSKLEKINNGYMLKYLSDCL